MHDILSLVISLIFIVATSIVFCNALEHLGESLGVSEGVTGSIFAAVGTALPETIIPVLAIFADKVQKVNMEIGVGTILGAPLMLSTLSLFIMVIAVLPKRGLRGRVTPEITGITRDLRFFMLSYMLAFVAALLPHSKISWLINFSIAVTLLMSYFIYVLLTIKSSKDQLSIGNETVATSRLHMEVLGFKANMFTITTQLIIALLSLVYFAHMFINSVRDVADTYGISAFLLSLIIVPIATELPEKINSIIWLRKGKDTLAIGNITGAMVFQGTLLPAIGILFTNWGLSNHMPVITIMLTMFATLWLYQNRNKLQVWHLLINGLLYIVNLVVCLAYH